MKLRNKKTGEDGRFMMCHDGDKYPFYIEATGSRFYYHDFSEMLEAGWECCTEPQEPLIKDENIRKAVRAWADANNIIEVCYDAVWDAFRMDDFVCSFDYDFDRHDGLVDGCHYTITQLCEEEE